MTLAVCELVGRRGADSCFRCRLLPRILRRSFWRGERRSDAAPRTRMQRLLWMPNRRKSRRRRRKSPISNRALGHKPTASVTATSAAASGGSARTVVTAATASSAVCAALAEAGRIKSTRDLVAKFAAQEDARREIRRRSRPVAIVSNGRLLPHHLRRTGAFCCATLGNRLNMMSVIT